ATERERADLRPVDLRPVGRESIAPTSFELRGRRPAARRGGALGAASAARPSCPVRGVDPRLCVPAFRRVCLFGWRQYRRRPREREGVCCRMVTNATNRAARDGRRGRAAGGGRRGTAWGGCGGRTWWTAGSAAFL